MAEGSCTPLPEVIPEGQMTRSPGPALSTLPGRWVFCHTFCLPQGCRRKRCQGEVNRLPARLGQKLLLCSIPSCK